MSKLGIKTVRKQLSEEAVNKALQRIKIFLDKKIAEKGRGAFVSRHEILGVIDEEVNELKMAVHREDTTRVQEELLDVIISCVWGYISIQEDAIDW